MLIVDHERLTRSFFRGVNSTALFRRFFDAYGVSAAMGLDEKAGPNQIHEAWEKLACPNREEIEESLCQINDIGREKGRFALQERAMLCGVEGYEDLTLEKLAIVLFLDHRDVFDAAYEFHTLEKAENLHTLIGRHPVPCEPTSASIEKFKDELGKALRNEAHGSHLLVEPARRHAEKWMAAIPHQTFVKPDHEFDERDGEKIVTRDRRPVYEMVLIYYPGKGVLKLKAGRGRKKVERAAACFATEILGQTPAFFQICNVVNFAPLQEPHFSFAPGPKDHFESVRPTRIRFHKHAHPGVEYEVHCKERYDRATNVLEQLVADGINLSEIEIQGLNLCFQFPEGSRDTRTVELGVPNRSSLDETERDRHIERALARRGIIDYAARDRLARAGLPG